MVFIACLRRHLIMVWIAIAPICGTFGGCGPSAKERASLNRAISSNNLRQISIATFIQESKGANMPPVVGGDDQPLLSWRVYLLPYLEQEELFKQFKLDEPWDSTHNKTLIEKMPKIYQGPGSQAAKEFKTVYLRPRSEKSAFPDNGNLFKSRRIADGVWNTIMYVEASDDKAVTWTKPDDYEIDEQNPSLGLIGLHKGLFMVVLCDGAVRPLPADIDSQTLNALYTRAGRESVNLYSIP